MKHMGVQILLAAQHGCSCKQSWYYLLNYRLPSKLQFLQACCCLASCAAHSIKTLEALLVSPVVDTETYGYKVRSGWVGDVRGCVFNTCACVLESFQAHVAVTPHDMLRGRVGGTRGQSSYVKSLKN